jgi:hypothetical protein
MSNSASQHTLNTLSQNSKDTMEEIINFLPSLIELEQLSKKVSDGQYNTIGSLIAHIQDLSLGSHFIIVEIMSLFRNMIDTKYLYEKIYYMEYLNQSFCEAYFYFRKKKNNIDVDGIWLVAKQKILQLQNPVLDSYITMIDKLYDDIKYNYCDIPLRNETSHFNDPIRKYKMLQLLNSEEHISKGVSQFMSLYMRMSQLCTILTAILYQFLPKQEPDTPIENHSQTDNFISILNERVSDIFHKNEKIIENLNQIITKSEKELNSDYNNCERLDRAIDFFILKGMKIDQFDVLRQLNILRMTVAFMKGDLACTIKSYLHSSTEIECALNLRRIFLVEINIFTKLYGYNKKKREQSLWVELRNLDNNHKDKEAEEIELKLEMFTNSFNPKKRNLYTHFREGEQLNIVKRYETYKTLNHAEELQRCLNLMSLCKVLEDYTMQVFHRYEAELNLNVNKNKEERSVLFDKFRTFVSNSELSEEIKKQWLQMFDNSEKQINDLFTE